MDIIPCYNGKNEDYTDIAEKLKYQKLKNGEDKMEEIKKATTMLTENRSYQAYKAKNKLLSEEYFLEDVKSERTWKETLRKTLEKIQNIMGMRSLLRHEKNGLYFLLKR